MRWSRVETYHAKNTAARATSSTQAGAISIAVLPFENLSGDATQEFFSDGMTEEITSALAKIADLRVVGRTSAFQFKGEKKDWRAIGQALLATHLLEGSVRKAGTRVRVAVQLIKTDDGKQIWSESYDRELTDVFAIQEDIATAISGALRMPLGLKAGEHLVSNRAIDPDSYQQYLRAKSLVRGRGQTGLLNSATLLEEIVGRNPNFAPAWALLALDYHLQPNSNPTRTTGSLAEFRNVVNALRPMAEAAAQRAVELDPNLADGRPRGAEILAWFNRAAFAAPAPGAFGNAGRNALIGPSAGTTNVGLFKTFQLPWREGLRLQFRSEFFNLFNSVNLSNPNASVSAGAQMGRITSAAEARVIQFALKLQW